MTVADPTLFACLPVVCAFVRLLNAARPVAITHSLPRFSASWDSISLVLRVRIAMQRPDLRSLAPTLFGCLVIPPVILSDERATCRA